MMNPWPSRLWKSLPAGCPFSNVAGKCSSATEAAELLRNTTIDLIFLDIHMPRLSGLDFISSLHNPPLFILVTAYSEYALQGFNVNATDYLMKPVPFDTVFESRNKAYELYQIKEQACSGTGFSGTAVYAGQIGISDS